MSTELQLVLAVIIKCFLFDNFLCSDLLILREFNKSITSHSFPLVLVFKIIYHAIVTLLVTIHISNEVALTFASVEAAILLILSIILSDQVEIRDLTWPANYNKYKRIVNINSFIHLVSYVFIINLCLNIPK